MKEQMKIKIEESKTKMDLYQIAGTLNNHPKHCLVDKVTIMAFMDFQEAKNHVYQMLEKI